MPQGRRVGHTSRREFERRAVWRKVRVKHKVRLRRRTGGVHAEMRIQHGVQAVVFSYVAVSIA